LNGILRIVTDDIFLGQKLYRELVPLFSHIDVSQSASGAADVFLFDTRTHLPEADAPSVFYLAEDPDGFPRERTLPLPLPIGLAASVLESENKAAPLVLSESERALRLYGKTVKLTEVEYSLLSALVRANGSFISRDALRNAVWGEQSSDGLLNVYIHYLREKLENDGERVILSSRKSGYALAEKFTRRDSEC
jgi:DNA-binding winged helix-turn-helix (wHTH) protein